MASNMATTSTTRRRAAQIARGQPDPILRAIARQVQLARERGAAGRQLPDVPVGNSGVIHRQREFSNPEAALRWGDRNLPPNSSAFVMARGTLRTSSGDREPGEQRQWVTLTRWTRARYLAQQQDEAQQSTREMLTTYQRVVLRWRER